MKRNTALLCAMYALCALSVALRASVGRLSIPEIAAALLLCAYCHSLTLTQKWYGAALAALLLAYEGMDIYTIAPYLSFEENSGAMYMLIGVARAALMLAYAFVRNRGRRTRLYWTLSAMTCVLLFQQIFIFQAQFGYITTVYSYAYKSAVRAYAFALLGAAALAGLAATRPPFARDMDKKAQKLKRLAAKGALTEEACAAAIAHLPKLPRLKRRMVAMGACGCMCFACLTSMVRISLPAYAYCALFTLPAALACEFAQAAGKRAWAIVLACVSGCAQAGLAAWALAAYSHAYLGGGVALILLAGAFALLQIPLAALTRRRPRLMLYRAALAFWALAGIVLFASNIAALNQYGHVSATAYTTPLLYFCAARALGLRANRPLSNRAVKRLAVNLATLRDSGAMTDGEYEQKTWALQEYGNALAPAPRQ